MTQQTQGQILAAALKRRAHTYHQMMRVCGSYSPHRRVKEWVKLNPDWRVETGEDRNGWTTWRIVRAYTGWTA